MSLLAAAADDGPSNPTPAAPAEAEPRVYGETVADARKLLKRAKRVFINVPIDDRGATGFIVISKQAFANSLKYERAVDPMPCELMMTCSKPTLTIGGIGAIYAARNAREARDAAASQ